MDPVGTPEQLGARVRQARLARAMDQSDLGHAARLDRTAISRIESGVRGVSALELTRIAGALRLTIPDLVFEPSMAVRSARTSLSEAASEQEASQFDAETALDSLMRDAQQLRDLGHLRASHVLEPGKWSGRDDARALAKSVRRAASLGTGAVGSVADLCAQFGLWVAPAVAAVDGLSATPEPGFGVAIVGSNVYPGRRRATALHELGHHLSGDAYTAELSVSASRHEKEQLIDLFSAELLLPSEVCITRLQSLSGSAVRAELIRICAEYRVSWTLALRIAREAIPAIDTSTLDATPIDADFLEVFGAKPQPDLELQTMAAAWVKACMAAVRSSAITPTRAAAMMRTSVVAADLQVR